MDMDIYLACSDNRFLYTVRSSVYTSSYFLIIKGLPIGKPFLCDLRIFAYHK